jgi:hypothetical protein
MFGHLYKKMTEACNHYLDWSRFGELLMSASHRYSKKELTIRGGIIAFTAASGFIGAYLNNEEKTQCGNMTMAIASAFMGFVFSHGVAISPLINKRIKISQECERIALEIKQTLPQQYLENKANVQMVIKAILDLSLSTNKHANASLTWGTRERLLRELQSYIKTTSFDNELWQDQPSVIVERLQDMMTTSESRLKVA